MHAIKAAITKSEGGAEDNDARVVASCKEKLVGQVRPAVCRRRRRRRILEEEGKIGMGLRKGLKGMQTTSGEEEEEACASMIGCLPASLPPFPKSLDTRYREENTAG